MLCPTAIHRAVAALLLSAAVFLLAGVHGVHGQNTIAGALACDRSHTALRFPLPATTGGSAATGPSAASLPNGAFDIGRPDIAVTCQLVLADPAADSPFALAPGTVSFSVLGPALIVESGGATYTVRCGDPTAPASCTGAVDASQPGDPAVTGTAVLTVHLALAPGTVPAAGVSANAVRLEAVYTPATGGLATVDDWLDLVPPTYNIMVETDRTVIGSARDSAVITAVLQPTDPSGCATLGQGPYMVCSETSAPAPRTGGVEPGTLTFLTTLGQFVNGESQIQASCGTPAAGTVIPPVPAAGQSLALPATCTTVAVRLSPGDQSGDAVISARFAGSITGAFAVGAVHVTVAPQVTTLTVHGCTEVRAPSTLPPGSPVSLLVESVDPPAAVVGVWRYDAQANAWEAGYLSDPQAPLQFTTVDPGEVVLLCVVGVAHYPLA